MNRVLLQLKEWLNELIRLRKLCIDAIKLSEMYRYIAVLLLSHTIGFSFCKTIDVHSHSGKSAPSLERIRFIASNILAFSATSHGQDGHKEWNSQRDQTQKLWEFEELSFRDTKKVFFVPLHLLATFDDDLYGTGANDNH
ncbi:hypothetical protein BWQ96_07002 [Gracilariopsis chorda]|uniref:Uncharacterized protein n=1 Tax=Gracilariopsis chorda TaxID=448386 RepID=A0A2V3IMG6_9FLOR|nr:hypothetical protein BWQ96_07002 [Gracilariopsis chorda]|eukprot:PXF43275.1 hypothetical protein BWQ96_07002 [Gracilariopsis chorda]